MARRTDIRANWIPTTYQISAQMEDNKSGGQLSRKRRRAYTKTGNFIFNASNVNRSKYGYIGEASKFDSVIIESQCWKIRMYKMQDPIFLAI